MHYICKVYMDIRAYAPAGVALSCLVLGGLALRISKSESLVAGEAHV